MAAPLYTPKEGLGSRYTDTEGKEYVFTNSGWIEMSSNISKTTQVDGTFEVKPDEKELETKLLGMGVSVVDVQKSITNRRRIKVNLDSQKQMQPDNTAAMDRLKEKNPSSPFGNMTKQELLREAFNKGVKDIDELNKLGDMYDMLQPKDMTELDEETMGVADSLRAEYFKRTNENQFLDIKQSYEKIKNTSDSAAGDVSLLFSYMKMLDPNSVVREGEFATAQNTAGVPGQITNMYNKALSGKRLNSDQRKGFIGEAESIFKVYKQRQEPIDNYYRKLSTTYGIDPSLVGIGLYDATEYNTDDPLNIGGNTVSTSNPLGI